MRSKNFLDNVKKTIAIYLKVERLINQNGWKIPLTAQQKEERKPNCHLVEALVLSSIQQPAALQQVV